MDNEQKHETEQKKTKIEYGWEYALSSQAPKEGSEWLNVYIPYLGTYGGIDDFVDAYISSMYADDIYNYAPDTSIYEAIDIDYVVDLGSYNKSYVDGVAELLCLDDLHLVRMSSPREYNFVTDTLHAQITKDEMWKLYESVKDMQYYKHLVEDVTKARDGYIPYYNEEDFFFTSKEDWSDDYDHPAIFEVIMKAALHEKLDMYDDDNNVAIELYLNQEYKNPLTEYVSIKSITITNRDGQQSTRLFCDMQDC